MKPIYNILFSIVAYLRDNLSFIRNYIIPYLSYHSYEYGVPIKSAGIGKLILCVSHILGQKLITVKYIVVKTL